MPWTFEQLDRHLDDLSILRRCWPEFRDKSRTHVVTVNGVKIGGEQPVMIAGPCAVESYDQAMQAARAVLDAGAQLYRGGVYKPRTNPHDFQGLQDEGLAMLAMIRKETGLGIVTEVMDPRLVEKVSEYADMLQLGTRSMYNYPLLKEVGRGHRPVLLKRAWSATLEEWLGAAEYIALEGNRNIVMCERGVRGVGHWSYSRGLLDLNVIDPLRWTTPLPIVVDPSHATGNWRLVPSMSRAALACGADGLLTEVIDPGTDRESLKCDADQGISPAALSEIVSFARTLVREKKRGEFRM